MNTVKSEDDMSRIKPDPDRWIRLLEGMIDSGEFEWAEEFLTDVKEYVEINRRITTKQTAAILKIRRATQ